MRVEVVLGKIKIGEVLDAMEGRINLKHENCMEKLTIEEIGGKSRTTGTSPDYQELFLNFCFDRTYVKS